MLYDYVFRVQTERLDSAMVRSTDAARWPLRDDFEDLAPLRHIIEDLSCILASQWWCCMVASICPRACWQGVCRIKAVAAGPRPPVVANTRGVKDECSTSLIRCS